MIFVILAIVLIVGIALLFVVDRGPRISTRGQDFENPESFIDKCVKDAVLETSDFILPQGGFVNPKDYKMHQGNKVTYLCKNINYYEPCVNQYPLYLNTLKKELDDELGIKIGQCFSLLEEELTQRNYQISGGNLKVNTKLKPGIVEVLVERDFTMSKKDFSRRFEDFRIFVKSPIFDLAFVAREIVSQESSNCYFNNDGFMALYPKFDIRRNFAIDGDDTKIYTMTYKNGGEKMNIAIRGCVLSG